MSVNRVILLGNVTRDAEIKTMSNGNEVANFSIATSEKWTDKNTKEKKDKTEYHKIVVFSQGLVGIVKNYVRKGTKLYVEGSLQTRKWTDNNNNDKYVTEIVLQGYGCALQLLDGKGKETTAQEFADRNGGKIVSSVGLAPQKDEFVDELEDDDFPL